MKPLVLGVLAFVLALPASCGGVFLLTKSNRVAATKGWALTPVVVAAVDVPEGAVLTTDMISQRSIPEQFVTEAHVRPVDVQLVIGRKVNFPLLAGDPITWGQFASLEYAQAADACRRAIHAAVDAAAKAAEQEALRKASEAPETGPVEPLPAPVSDAANTVKVVVASEDLSEGAALQRRHLATADFPAHLVTASLVPAAELEALVDAQVVVPVQKGDPLFWVQLARPGGPETVAGCALRVEAAVAAAKRLTSEREAKAWKPGGKEAP
ncbi:MAG: SAF domain-containing protein [Myxococcota bacterium]